MVFRMHYINSLHEKRIASIGGQINTHAKYSSCP
jgi:hypothetical protein